MNWNSLSTRKWPDDTVPSDSRSRRTSSTSSGSRPRTTASSCADAGPSTSSRFVRTLSSASSKFPRVGSRAKYTVSSSPDDVRALEFPERLVQWVLRYLGRAEELLVGPRLLADQGEELLLLRLEPGPLRVHGDVRRDVVLRRP